MMLKVGFLAMVSTAALTAHAQSSSASATSPSSTAGLTACIASCLQNATSSSGCPSFTDMQCVCTNTQFQQAAEQCLQSKCTSAEQTTALALQKSECASLSSSVSGSASAKSSASSSTTTSSASSSSSSSSSTSTSSAAAEKIQFGYGGLLGVAVALVGAVIGADLVL